MMQKCVVRSSNYSGPDNSRAESESIPFLIQEDVFIPRSKEIDRIDQYGGVGGDMISQWFIGDGTRTTSIVPIHLWDAFETG